MTSRSIAWRTVNAVSPPTAASLPVAPSPPAAAIASRARASIRPIDSRRGSLMPPSGGERRLRLPDQFVELPRLLDRDGREHLAVHRDLGLLQAEIGRASCRERL